MADNKIATLNVNSISATMRTPMPSEFLYEQETEIILLHEVTPTEFGLIRGDNVYINVGIKKRGIVMLTRETIKVTSHAVAIREGNGIVLSRRLYSKYMCTVWLKEKTGERKFLKCGLT